MRTDTATEWTRIPVADAAHGRGLGVLDLAHAILDGRVPRASADTAIHVLDALESITASAVGNQDTTLTTTCAIAEPLPDSWNPQKRSA
jgi:hypothetical protein